MAALEWGVQIRAVLDENLDGLFHVGEVTGPVRSNMEERPVPIDAIARGPRVRGEETREGRCVAAKNRVHYVELHAPDDSRVAALRAAAQAAQVYPRRARNSPIRLVPSSMFCLVTG